MARTLMDLRTKTAVLIGSGNVATRFGLTLQGKITISQVYSPHVANARKLAGMLGATAVDDTESIDQTADVYIVAISDDSIAELAAGMQGRKGVWMHTSGSVPMSALDGVGDSHGVLYPLQTFSKGVATDFSKIHFLTEASDGSALALIDSLAKATGSENIHHITSKQRQRIHLAAVFACNFANYMWINAEDLLSEVGLHFDALLPLVQATLDKAVLSGPAAGQTGPARRGDVKVIRRHLEMLPHDKAEVYGMLSDKILKMFGHEQN